MWKEGMEICLHTVAKDNLQAFFNRAVARIKICALIIRAYRARLAFHLVSFCPYKQLFHIG
jgi:hypothetical protein